VCDEGPFIVICHVPLTCAGTCQFPLTGLPVFFGNVDRDFTIRLPVGERKVVRHDARAGAQLAHELRLKVLHHAGQQIQRKHRRLRDVRLENVLLNEFDAITDAALLRLVVAAIDELGIDIDSHAARTVAQRCGKHDTSITRAEIHDVVFGRDLRQIEHRIDDRLRCGNEWPATTFDVGSSNGQESEEQRRGTRPTDAAERHARSGSG